MANARWSMAGNVARLVVDSFEGEVRADSPERGVHQLRWDHEAQAGYLLGVNFGTAIPAAPCVVEESYIRGRDLIASYRQTELQPFRPQVYWRASHDCPPHHSLVALDLIASVQTSLLDSKPELMVTSSLPADEVWRVSQDSLVKLEPAASQSEDLSAGITAGWILYRLPGGQRSFAMMIHPHDRHHTSLLRDSRGQIRWTCRLFAGHLEKGVVLRARLRCVLVDQATDLAAGADWMRAFLSGPLPLTV
jgi:hypothetical protein